MEQSVITEHDCNVLGGLFQIIVNDLKGGASTWEDFLLKASKFQNQLKATITSSTAFLDSFQKVADMATTTRGGTKEIGTALTRLCLRHRSVEAKLKSFSSAILDCLIIPLQDRIEEWKKTTVQLDKEHSKEMKRLRQEFKKRQICDPLMTSNSFRSKKHSSRMGKNSKYDFGIYGTIGAANKSSNSNLSRSLDSEIESNERLQQSLMLFEDLEKKAVRRALIEERSHFCLLVNFLRPVVEEEIAMIQEISHIQEIMESLCKLTTDPFDLPPSSETVISSLKVSKNGSTVWNFQSPPSSPSSLGSRKSSMCSISSYNSSSSSSTYGPTGPNKYLSLTHIPTSTYTTNIYSQSNIQSESVYAKKTDSPSSQVSSQLESTVTSNGRYGNGNESSTAHELQFPSDSTDSSSTVVDEHGFYRNPPLILNSTNPFLNSYTPEVSIYQSTNTSSQNSYSSVQSEGNIFSEGSITPTNCELVGNAGPFSPQTEQPASTSTKSSKPPPAPPVRRTSSISNPNAITMGTLKSAGISPNYDEAGKNLSVYDEINVLTKSMNDINYTLKYTDFANATTSSPSSNSPQATVHSTEDSRYNTDKSGEYHSVKNVFENHYISPPMTTRSSIDEDSSQLPLPAPPPEAFIDMSSSHPEHHHYNKITNVHRDFLETLNSKLSQSPLANQSSSSRSSKRRNSNHSSDDCDSSLSSHQGKSRSSTARSASTTRTLSRKNSFEKSALIGNFRENFIDKLNHSLVAKHQNAEIAKAAATNALQRKQSVPDLNELNNASLKSQNRVTFSSSLNLNAPSQSGGFQVVQIQTNPTQQPIYASRNQLRREIQELYGSLGTGIYGSLPSDSSYLNGFFNKL